MELPRLRSPLARAVAPVLAGIVFFALLFLATWGVATVVSRNGENVTNLGSRIFEVGRVDSVAAAVDEGGPLLFPDLKSASGTRSIVLDHTGSDPAKGWQVYYAYPADRTADCLVAHTPKTRDFIDCESRTLTPEQLALPTDVCPIVENKTRLYIDLRGANSSCVVRPSTQNS